MAITISGENNNDKILASDGVIDSLSSLNIAGIATATTFVGNLTGNVTGDVGGNLTGNVTGNVNNTSNLLLQIGGTEKLRLNSDRVIIGQTLSNNQPTYNTSTTFVTTHTNNPGAWNAIAIIGGHTTGASFLKFGDRDNEAVSQIGHYNDDNSLRFYTNGFNERLRIASDGLTTLSNFNGTGLKLQGSGSDYQGVQLQVTDASASQTRNVFIDAVNENGHAVANMVGSVQSDGGSAWIWQTQPSGTSRTATNGRVERLRITADGNIGFNRDTVNAGDNETQLATATPNRFVFNNHYSNGYTDNSLKLYLFNDGATRQGFTSGPLYDLQYHSSGHATHAKHSFFTQNVEALRIDASSLVTKPQHPAFFVTMNGGDQTTAAANIMPFDTVVHNNGGHFKTSGADIYNFVCPVDGYYFFGGQVWLKHGSGTGNHARWEIWRDTQVLALAGWHQNGVNLHDMQSSASVTVYCTAGAKVYMEADYALTYWRGSASQPHTFFHGHLIG